MRGACIQQVAGEIRRQLSAGASLAVEAWNRSYTAKIATGHLIAIDNQIDINTGSFTNTGFAPDNTASGP